MLVITISLHLIPFPLSTMSCQMSLSSRIEKGDKIDVPVPEATQVEKLITSFEKQLAVKDGQLKKSNELLEKYTILLEEKNERIEQLLNRIIDLSDRVVQYPAKKHQTPMLLVAREINGIRAITGQKVYVAKMKRDLAPNADIIINTVRPNPQVDFNNIMNEVETTYNDKIRTRNKRNLVFQTEDDAIEVANMCKSLLVPIKKLKSI